LREAWEVLQIAGECQISFTQVCWEG